MHDTNDVCAYSRLIQGAESQSNPRFALSLHYDWLPRSTSIVTQAAGLGNSESLIHTVGLAMFLLWCELKHYHEIDGCFLKFCLIFSLRLCAIGSVFVQREAINY